MNVTAIGERSGDGWAVNVPEIEGGFTQAKRLDQVPVMVADLVSLANGTPATNVVVHVNARVPDPDALTMWATASEEAAAGVAAGREVRCEERRHRAPRVGELGAPSSAPGQDEVGRDGRPSRRGLGAVLAPAPR